MLGVAWFAGRREGSGFGALWHGIDLDVCHRPTGVDDFRSRVGSGHSRSAGGYIRGSTPGDKLAGLVPRGSERSHWFRSWWVS